MTIPSQKQNKEFESRLGENRRTRLHDEGIQPDTTIYLAKKSTLGKPHIVQPIIRDQRSGTAVEIEALDLQHTATLG